MTDNTILSLIGGAWTTIIGVVFKLFLDVSTNKDSASQHHKEIQAIKKEVQEMKDKNAEKQIRIELMKMEIHNINLSLNEIKESQKKAYQEQQKMSSLLIEINAQMQRKA